MEHPWAHCFASSFHTDFSAYKRSDFSFQPGVSTWDIYHTTVGAMYKKGHSEFGLGLTWSYGKDDEYVQQVNFPTASEANKLLGDTQQTTATYNAISMLLGYSYVF